jgi:hypothetical protein
MFSTVLDKRFTRSMGKVLWEKKVDRGLGWKEKISLVAA